MRKLNSCFASLLVLGISGCGWQNLFTVPDGSKLYKHVAWARQEEALFEPYLGMTTQEIESIFGKPKSTDFAKTVGMWWDEVWIYGELPIANAKVNFFYFKDHRLVKVGV